jgi:uncharacterized integral membrane protein (TIGR00697 family)
MATETETGSDTANGSPPGVRLTIPQLGLAALFVTALITAQVTAVKVLSVDLPVALPVTGSEILVPAAVFAYALTFFASDCYAELYGKRDAQALVNVAFVMNFVLLVLVWLAIWAPISGASEVAQESFANTLAASTGVVTGSLLAYIVSQNWDVIAFHWLKDYTDGDRLWLRNIASTATSQLIDTVIFITVAFLVFQGLPTDVVIELVVGQYLFKLALVGLDTPFVYLVVGLVRSRDWAEPA